MIRTLIALLFLPVVGSAIFPQVAHAALISTEQEIRIGRQAAAELEREFGRVQNPVQERRLERIGLRLARRSSRPTLPWRFRIAGAKGVNAISLPGGFIYVTPGLLRFVRSDEELAAVLGHEVAHVNQRHHVTLLERHFYLAIIIAVLTGGDPTTGAVGDFVGFLLTRGFSRDFEFEADAIGVEIAHRAGFRADAALHLMERLRVAEGRDPSQFETLFRTHPGLNDRIVRLRAKLRAMGYRV